MKLLKVEKHIVKFEQSISDSSLLESGIRGASLII